MKHPEMLHNDSSFYVIAQGNVTSFEKGMHLPHYSDMPCTQRMLELLQEFWKDLCCQHL